MDVLVDTVLDDHVTDASAAAQAFEHFPRVGTERQIGEHSIELIGRDPGEPGDLARLRLYGAVPPRLVHGAPRLPVGAPVAVLEEEPKLGALDTDLLGDLAARALVVGFAGGADAAREDVVRAGEHILGVGAAVHEDVARRVLEQHVGAAMQELTAAHLAPCHRRHDAVVLVDHVHELVSWIMGVRAARPARLARIVARGACRAYELATTGVTRRRLDRSPGAHRMPRTGL